MDIKLSWKVYVNINIVEYTGEEFQGLGYFHCDRLKWSISYSVIPPCLQRSEDVKYAILNARFEKK